MHLVTEAQAEVKRHTTVGGAAGWMWRALQGWKVQQEKREARKNMRVVETLGLGAKNKLVLVSCGGERFLIGTGPESVGTIVRLRPESASTLQTRERGEAR